MVHGFWGCCLVTVAVRATAPELACTEDAGECSWKPQSAHGPAQDLPTLLWMAPMLNPGGFSSEALSYAEALQKAYEAHGHAGRFGVRQFAEQMRDDFVQGLPDRLLTRISQMMKEGKRRQNWDVVVCHSTPDVWHEDGAFSWGRIEPCPPRGAQLSIGRGMYETDRLPESWVPRLNRMDQVWVPSHFGLEQFVSSGVKREKIVVVPEAVDTDLFDPKEVKPLDLGPGVQSQYRFLSVFKWEKRKGWDILLRAYFEEFSAADNVLLIIKTQSFHSGDDFHRKVLQEIHKAQAGGDAKNPADYKLLSNDLALKDLPRLYRAADAFVLPSRGEGWGRPHVEAMSMALPVIATNWSGSTEFLRANVALPLPVDGLEAAATGHGRWAVPSRAQLRRLMRWAVQHPAEAKAIGEAARLRMVEQFSPEHVVSHHILPLLQRYR